MMAKPYPAEHYALVAEVYQEAVEAGLADGTTRTPDKDIAQMWGVPHTTAARWVKEARRRGLLPPGHRGRAGPPVCRGLCPACCERR
jgi:hypothetical protein